MLPLPPTLVCRPALPKDTPEVLALTRLIWEGEDYIPFVWADWLSDPAGLLFVAEYGGKVVGLGKLTRLGQGEWWLEGLRVHPQYEGQGFGSHIHDYALGCWVRLSADEQGSSSLRLVTSSHRIPVHRMCERTGFVKIGEITQYEAPAIEGGATSLIPILPEDLPEALEYAVEKSLPGFPSPLMDTGWTWAEVRYERLEEAVQQGLAWWWVAENGERKGLLLLRADEEESEPQIQVEHIACEVADLSALLLSARVAAHNVGYAHLIWFALIHPLLQPVLEQSGFTRAWEDSLYLFEKRALDNRQDLQD